jgi:hypothetical protein
MELYQFSWGSGSDEECYSFFTNIDRESVINLMSSFKDADGDVCDYDEFENYAMEHGIEITRYFHEEPTYIHSDEID